MTDQNNALAIVNLPPAERAMIALDSKTAESQLRAMLDESADITEVKDKDSRTMAHNAGMKLKGARVAIEKTGKAAREDANAFAKAVIDEEKRLKSIIADEEARLFALRDEYDRKIEAERQARERQERERVEAIRSKIDAIKALPLDSANDTSAQLQQTLQDLQAFEIDDSFAEFKDEAAQVAAASISALQVLWKTACDREAEAVRLQEERDRLAAERAEIERMRAEIAAQQAALQAAQSPAAATEEETQADMFGAQENAAEAEETAPAPILVADLDEEREATTMDANAFVMELAKHTAMQFEAMAEKVGIVATAVQVDELRKGFKDFAMQLRNIAGNLEAGHFDDALLNADWSAMGNADKAIALASHAGVALIFGDEAMGGSTLRQAAE